MTAGGELKPQQFFFGSDLYQHMDRAVNIRSFRQQTWQKRAEESEASRNSPWVYIHFIASVIFMVIFIICIDQAVCLFPQSSSEYMKITENVIYTPLYLGTDATCCIKDERRPFLARHPLMDPQISKVRATTAVHEHVLKTG